MRSHNQGRVVEDRQYGIYDWRRYQVVDHAGQTIGFRDQPLGQDSLLLADGALAGMQPDGYAIGGNLVFDDSLVRARERGIVQYSTRGASATRNEPGHPRQTRECEPQQHDILQGPAPAFYIQQEATRSMYIVYLEHAFALDWPSWRSTQLLVQAVSASADSSTAVCPAGVRRRPTQRCTTDQDGVDFGPDLCVSMDSCPQP